MNILQLRQSQLPGLPFIYYKELGYLDKRDSPVAVEKEGRYLIVPTSIKIAVKYELDMIANSLLEIAKLKGFTHLMLMYV